VKLIVFLTHGSCLCVGKNEVALLEMFRLYLLQHETQRSRLSIRIRSGWTDSNTISDALFT
jgi:hypothetical protein